jgi:uncharacterized protein
MRVVIDVNVWISGLLWAGTPGQIIRLAYDQTIISYVSTELLQELAATLRRPKFQSRLAKCNQTVENLLAIVTTLSQCIEIVDIDIPELRDPADIKILATAIVANAKTLITGDQDLLVLESVQSISILTPTQFLSTLSSNS